MSGWNLTGSILIINLKCAEHRDGGGLDPSAHSCPALSAGTSLVTPQASQASSSAGTSSLPRCRICVSHSPLSSLTPYFAQRFLVFLISLNPFTDSTVPAVQAGKTEAWGGNGVCVMPQHTIATGRIEPLHFLVWAF